MAILYFTVLGIFIPGFFYSKSLNLNKTLLAGINGAFISSLIGLLLQLLFDFHDTPYLQSFVGGGVNHFQIWTPMIFGVIGFNIGIERKKFN